MTDQQPLTRQPTPEESRERIKCQLDTITLLGTHVKVLRMQLNEYEKKYGRISEPTTL